MVHFMNDSSKADFERILKRAVTKKNGIYRYDLSFTTYYPSQAQLEVIANIGQGESAMLFDCQVKGRYLFSPENFRGELFLEEIPDFPDFKDFICKSSLSPSKQFTTNAGNYERDDRRVSFYSTDLDGCRWSLHCGFSL